MNLNNIKLTSEHLSHLYSDVLIDLPPAITTNQPTVSYLGGNAKNILVVINNADIVYLTDNETVFLSNILTACKLTLADIAIVNFAHMADTSYNDIINEMNPTSALLFDVGPVDFGLPIHFPHYQLQTFKGCTYLSAPSLKILEADLAQKKQFWGCLKKIFGL